MKISIERCKKEGRKKGEKNEESLTITEIVFKLLADTFIFS